ncbi:MAG: S-layer homology domain-containing protein [Bacillota bacterium]|jgi:nitrate/TMAO reductase-like tetraheme cytochrome c subunit|nr:S-layer homology domain-containing protein [Thermoanaerobacteraceae bacterium]
MGKILRRWRLVVLVAVGLTLLGGGLALAFSDTENHWAKSAVNWAAERGLVKGYSDGSFKPDKAVSRAEVAQMFQNYQNWRELARRPQMVPRGCSACHVANAPGLGDVRIAAEAKKKKPHPDLPPDATVDTCISCHKGDFADMIHVAHANSPVFTEKYFGNCWSCHKVAEGKFTLLP